MDIPLLTHHCVWFFFSYSFFWLFSFFSCLIIWSLVIGCGVMRAAVRVRVSCGQISLFLSATALICRFRAICLHAFASLIYSTHSYWKKKKTLSKCHLMFLVKILQIYQTLRHLNGVSYFHFRKFAVDSMQKCFITVYMLREWRQC